MIASQPQYPFTAIVGQEDFKLALILNCIDPLLGGVLAIGDKGTGKTTLIRSLAALMASSRDFPFVNLPIGVSEDRVLGHLNLEKLINEKKEVVQLGLLSKADNGCLYIDEINLLNDYLMDVLLDAAVSGNYHLEREGLSKKVDSRFCLIGSMNPEEGDLRPQLKDRFGLSVAITTSIDIKERAQIVKNRLLFDDAPLAFTNSYDAQQKTLENQINKAILGLHKLPISDALLIKAAEIGVANGVEGHRADILLIKTARAYAAFLNDTEITEAHLEKIAPFVLLHRSTKKEAPQQNKQQEEQEKEQAQQPEEKEGENAAAQAHQFKAVLPENTPKWESANSSSKNGMQTTRFSEQQQKSVAASAHKVMDVRKSVGQYLATDKFEFKHKFTQVNTQMHLLFMVDSSGSMLKDKMVAYAKGLVEKYANEAPGKKPLFSLISLFDGDAELLQEATSDINAFQEALAAMQTGGKTNITAAFKLIKGLKNRCQTADISLVIVTDAKFNSSQDNPFDEAVLACQTYCKGIQNIKVIDAEKGRVKLGLAAKFAAKIKAKYEPLEIQKDV